MSNLDNIKNSILEDARTKSEKILKEAREEEQRLIERKTYEGREIEKMQLERAKRESAAKKERIISSAKLRVRNDKLAAKQKIIDEVFQKAIEALNSMEAKEFQGYVVNRIAAMDITGDEALMLNNPEDKELVNKINEKLKAQGKKGNIKISNAPSSLQGGFILEKDGIQINNTFEALVNSMRDEMEYEIAKILFD